MFNIATEKRLTKFMSSVENVYDKICEEVHPGIKLPLIQILGADTFNTMVSNIGGTITIHDDDLVDSMGMLVVAPVLDNGIIVNFAGSIVMPYHNISRLFMSGISDDEAMFEVEHTLRHECGHVVDTMSYLKKPIEAWDARSDNIHSAYDTLPKLRSNASMVSIFNWYVQYHNLEEEVRADNIGGVSIKDYAIDFVLSNKEVPYRKLGISEYISKEEHQMILSGNYRSIVV